MPVEEPRTRKFHSRTYAIDTIKGVNLAGQTFVITGTTNGIGIETARSLVLHGAHVKIVDEMHDAEIDIIKCDLNSLKSVKTATEEYISKGWPINCLILNAGVFGTASTTTSDGLESHFGINHLAHFLLIRELLPIVRQSAPSKIILVSSTVHAQCEVTPDMPILQKVRILCPESPDDATWFVYENHNEISTYSVHPGNGVRTNIFRDSWLVSIASILSTPFTKNISQGAATTVYCAGNPEVAHVSGKYWESCWDDEKTLYNEVARDEELQDAVWEHSQKLLNKLLDSKLESCVFEC
ncbi:unnamed protein product [Caenorhabditis sp. 36 PRJEB53466]|nr:unnamed protein product [Caenorhabditis sp. 36 PRJEB53466]